MVGGLNMAIWQCDFQLIPENFKEQNNEWLSGNLWIGYSISNKSIEDLSKIIPLTRSWSEDIIQYGSNDETCVQLFLENEIICDIRIRISINDLDLNKVAAIIEFSKSNNGVLIFDNKIILPEIRQIIRALENSDAVKFSENPIKFFTDLNS